MAAARHVPMSGCSHGAGAADPAASAQNPDRDRSETRRRTGAIRAAQLNSPDRSSMPRAELPSGNWVDYRDKLMVADRFMVQDALSVTYETRPDGTETRRQAGAVMEQMRVALLKQIITAWSFPGVPVPAQNIASAEECLGSVLDLDDYYALAAEVEPLFEAVTAAPKTVARKTAPAEPAAGAEPAAATGGEPGTGM